MTKEPEDKREDAEEDDASEDEGKAPDLRWDDLPGPADKDDASEDEEAPTSGDTDEAPKPSDEKSDADEEAPDDSDDEEAPDDSDDEEAPDDSDDEDEPEDEEDKPAPAEPKPAAKKKTAGKKLAKKPGAGVARAGRRRKPPDKGSSTRNIILYIVVIGGIALAFAYLGQQEGGGGDAAPAPKWKKGDTPDVSITIVTTDVKDLACASETEIEGLHCGYADKRKPHPKGNDTRNDATLLQPYTTTDRIQFLAAGMWTQPEIKAKLEKEDWENPSPRFTVNCKYEVAGKMSEAHVRWKPEHGWLADAAADWYAGKLTDCKIRRSGRAIPRSKRKPEPADKETKEE